MNSVDSDNAGDMQAFIHCMNFRSTSEINAENTNYMGYLNSVYTEEAEDSDDVTACKLMTSNGLNWLSANEIKNWNAMCGNTDLRTRMLAQWSNYTDDGDYELSAFTTDFAVYWNFVGDSTYSDNNGWFTASSANMYGNESACNNVFPASSVANSSVSTCSGVAWENAGNVQPFMLNDTTRPLLNASTNSNDLCFATVSNTTRDQARNCCLNSNTHSQFSSCVRTAFGVSTADETTTFANLDVNTTLGYDNVRKLQEQASGASTSLDSWTAFNSHADAKQGSYGFLSQMRYWELNCLFDRNSEWYTKVRSNLFQMNVRQAANDPAPATSYEQTYNNRLDIQPSAFEDVNTIAKCQELAGAECASLHQWNVPFGSVTFNTTGSNSATCLDAGLPSPTLPHCCSAQYDVDMCPGYSVDANWVGDERKGLAFALDVKAQFANSFADVQNYTSRADTTGVSDERSGEKIGLMTAYFSQLPIPYNVLDSLVEAYANDDGSAFEMAANGDADNTTSGCNNSATANNVTAWVDCMICNVGGNLDNATDGVNYTQPTEYLNQTGCQDTEFASSGSGSGSGSGGSGSGNGTTDGNTDGNTDEVVCPDGCAASVLNALGMSVIFAFIINMMN